VHDRSNVERLEGGKGFRQALRPFAPPRPVSDRVRREIHGMTVDEDPTCRRQIGQTRRDVHGIPDDSEAGLLIGGGHHHLS
jgi:hypothetical protein